MTGTVELLRTKTFLALTHCYKHTEPRAKGLSKSSQWHRCAERCKLVLFGSSGSYSVCLQRGRELFVFIRCHSCLHPWQNSIGVTGFGGLQTKLKRRKQEEEKREASGKESRVRDIEYNEKVRKTLRKERNSPLLCARVIVVCPLTGRTLPSTWAALALLRAAVSCKAWEKPPARKNFHQEEIKACFWKGDLRHNAYERILFIFKSLSAS